MTPNPLTLAATLTLTLTLTLSIGAAADWPQWLGPKRNGTTDQAITDALPADGVKPVWSVKVGAGWAAPVVADERLIVFHRLDDRETVDCLDPATGQRRWRFDYPTDYRDSFGFDEGPRATPTVDAGHVFTHGAAGVVHGIDLDTGKALWSVDTVERFGSDPGFFGRVCSPLVNDTRVILQVGGRDGAGIVALDRRTGRTLWTATDHEAGYSSPVFTDVDGRRLAVCLTREGLVVLDPANGKVLHERRFRSTQHASVNGATPLVDGPRVLLSASYDTGAALLDIAGQRPQTIWESDDAISAHYATPVRRGDLVFGFHGRQERGPELRCVEWATGKVRWSEPSGPAGSVLVADDQLVVLTERGELILAPAIADKFAPTARAQVLGFDSRAYPALAGGMLYARDKRQLICIDLRKQP